MTPLDDLLRAPAAQATTEEVAAQRQWVETGTVPLDYLAARKGTSMSTTDDPILSVLRSALDDTNRDEMGK